MSTATAFKYHRPFPFCPGTTAPTTSGTGAYDYVDVILDEAMALWWNLESLTIDVVGETSTGNTIAGTFDVTDPSGYSPGRPYFIFGSIQVGEPMNRVCTSTFGTMAVEIFPQTSAGTDASSGTVIFQLREISGQLRVYYRFLFSPRASNNVMVTNPAANYGASYSDTAASGTITVAGIDFQWKGQQRTSAIITVEPEITGYSTGQFTY